MNTFRNRPSWVDEEPLIQSILHELLDQIERKDRAQFRINSKTTPELFDEINDDPGYLWNLLKTLDNEYRVITVRKGRARGREAYDNAQLFFNPDKEPQIRQWLNRPAFDPYTHSWDDSLNKTRDAFEDGGLALDAPIRAEGKTANEVIKGFTKLASEIQRPQTLRNLSSKCFWGDSKFLDNHSSLVYELFPQASHNILARPIVMNIFLPDEIHEVIFVENQDSFLMLKQIGETGHQLSKTALIYSEGFKVTSPTVRRRGSVVFSTIGSSSVSALKEFEDWWFGTQDQDWSCFFWGDMDYAGLGILKALRRSFESIEAWALGYGKMIDFHREGHGQTIRDSKKMQQLDPGHCGCRLADETLLPAIRKHQRFLDQEVVAMFDLRLS
jgi:hypothetical protein